MGVVRYVAKRRFNHIDMLTIMLMSAVVQLTGNVWLTAMTFIVGFTLSVLAELATGWR